MAIAYLDARAGVRIAVNAMRPEPARLKLPGFFWLGGFRSEMTGAKASRLMELAQADDRPFCRFDYSGHGQSEGAFTDGTISLWLAEAEAVLREFGPRPAVLIGSSMGAYLALLLALRMKDAGRIAGLVLVAPATDMTERLVWPSLDADERRQVVEQGLALKPSAYGAPDPITHRLIEDGRRHLLLGGAIDLGVGVRILHGDRDRDVPWQHGLATHEAIVCADAQFILIKGGDHRLSRDQDIMAIHAAAESLAIRAPRPAGP